jgi:hypothetical protein
MASQNVRAPVRAFGAPLMIGHRGVQPISRWQGLRVERQYRRCQCQPGKSQRQDAKMSTKHERLLVRSGRPATPFVAASAQWVRRRGRDRTNMPNATDPNISASTHRAEPERSRHPRWVCVTLGSLSGPMTAALAVAGPRHTSVTAPSFRNARADSVPIESERNWL